MVKKEKAGSVLGIPFYGAGSLRTARKLVAYRNTTLVLDSNTKPFCLLSKTLSNIGDIINKLLERHCTLRYKDGFVLRPRSDGDGWRIGDARYYLAGERLDKHAQLIMRDVT